MTPPKKTRSARKSISRQDFMKLCEWLREHREVAEREQTYIDAHKKVVAASGMDVAISTVKDAMNYVGLKLTEPPRKTPAKPTPLQVLAREIIAISKVMGRVPSDEVLALSGIKPQATIEPDPDTVF